MAKKLNIQEVKSRLKIINPNIEIISNEYENSRTILECRCLLDGCIWKTNWANLSQGKGCSVCSKNKKLTIDIVKKRLQELNPNLEILSDEYINNRTKLSCRCNSCGHIWNTKWDNLYNRHRCPNCCTSRKDYTIEDIKKKMLDLNEDILVISKEYNGSRDKLTFKCLKCGRTWESVWAYMKEYKECYHCKKIKTTQKLREKLQKIKPDILIIDEEYENNSQKLNLQCKKCGYSWRASWANIIKPSRALNLTECPNCTGYRKDIDIQYIKEKLKNINPYIQILDNTFVNSFTPMRCKCKICAYIWSVKWSKISAGRGCPSCNSSAPERMIMKFLDESNIDYFKEYVFENLKGSFGFLRFDFAILNKDKKVDLLIEYDGEFHYKKFYEEQNFDKQQRYDKLKNEYCIKNNIPLIRIPYWEKDNISEILTDIFICKNLNNKFIVNNNMGGRENG